MDSFIKNCPAYASKVSTNTKFRAHKWLNSEGWQYTKPVGK